MIKISSLVKKLENKLYYNEYHPRYCTINSYGLAKKLVNKDLIEILNLAKNNNNF